MKNISTAKRAIRAIANISIKECKRKYFQKRRLLSVEQAYNKKLATYVNLYPHAG